MIVNERQREAVAECGDALVSALEALDGGLNEEIVVVVLHCFLFFRVCTYYYTTRNLKSKWFFMLQDEPKQACHQAIDGVFEPQLRVVNAAPLFDLALQLADSVPGTHQLID